mgnify:CR=1 FL=1
MLPSDANCKSDALGVHDRLASGDSQSRSCKTPRISIKICISWRVGIIQLKVGGWCVIRSQRLHFDWSLKCDSRCAKSHSFFVNVPPDSVVTGRSCPFSLSTSVYRSRRPCEGWVMAKLPGIWNDAKWFIHSSKHSMRINLSFWYTCNYYRFQNNGIFLLPILPFKFSQSSRDGWEDERGLNTLKKASIP